MYAFPLIETPTSKDISKLINHPDFLNLFNQEYPLEISCFNEKEIVHKLTHQHIYTKFWIIKTESHPKAKLLLSELNKYPVSTLIHNFLEAINLS